jgi:hypothetical protein
MPTFEITGVSDRVRDWTSQKGGPMKSYRVNLKAADGAATTNVELSQKADTPPPAVGGSVDGTIDTSGEYGPKFKKEFQQGGRGGGGRPRDPAETAAIQRQHSQHMALLYVQAKAAAGELPAEFKPSQLTPIINWFDTDIQVGVDRWKARKSAGNNPTGG